jgi:hypothetical protein
MSSNYADAREDAGLRPIVEVLADLGDVIGAALAIDEAAHRGSDAIRAMLAPAESIGDLGPRASLGIVKTYVVPLAVDLGVASTAAAASDIPSLIDRVGGALDDVVRSEGLGTAFDFIGYLNALVAIDDYLSHPSDESEVHMIVEVTGVATMLLAEGTPFAAGPGGYAIGEQLVAAINGAFDIDLHESLAEGLMQLDEAEARLVHADRVALFGSHGPASFIGNAARAAREDEPAAASGLVSGLIDSSGGGVIDAADPVSRLDEASAVPVTDAPAPAPPTRPADEGGAVFRDEGGQPIGSAAPPVTDALPPPPPTQATDEDAGTSAGDDGDLSAGPPPAADAADATDG